MYIYIYTHPNTIQEDKRSESLLIKDEQAAAPESAGTGQGLHGMIYGDMICIYGKHISIKFIIYRNDVNHVYDRIPDPYSSIT